MRIAISRRLPATERQTSQLVEIVTPRTNAAALTSAENFFASVTLGEPFSLELASDSHQRQFLIRATSPPVRDQVLSQLAAAYPQADFRELTAEQDPAACRAGEQLAACTLSLRGPAYLPLRTFTDLDVDGERAAQADPVLGILSALGDLPPGWRGLSQLVLLPAEENWCRDYQRFSVQHPLEHERVTRPGESAGPMLAFVAVLLLTLVACVQGALLARAEQWPALVLLACACVGGLIGLLWLARHVLRPNLYDMELVREKVTRIACRAEVRLTLYAPSEAPSRSVNSHLARLATAYRRFNLAAANGFVAHRVPAARTAPCAARPWGPRRRLAVLTTLELAGVWHLPHAAADVALLERTTARRWLPLPAAVLDGCRIGTSRHQGREIPVALPTDVLRRHLLLVAKTRRGKSTLMQRLARHSMQAEPRRAVLLVDPHRDLAEAMLGLIPAARTGDLVFLDVANEMRPFGLNLLDTGLGWNRDRAVGNALAVFQREWGDRYWGPRMEDAFRFALMTLFEANTVICRADPVYGRARQHTLLEVPTILSDTLFRRELLATLDDPVLHAWWTDYYDSLERRFQLEVMNPVLTKVHRFEGSTPGRHIVGQPVSTIDPSAWLREGAIVIVNTARGIIGESAAALIGSTLLNLVTLAVAEQATLSAEARWPISIFVDEFHTIPGADYEGILAELSKYGANLVLATQSLARLLAIGQEEGRGLRATVFANLDGLFAFNCSAEDAEYLVAELGGAIDEQDLLELGEHQCYVRLSSRGQRLPTFSVHLDPPLESDPRLRAALARASAERFGRDVALVEADRHAAVARLLESRARHVQAVLANHQPHLPAPAKAPARNEHRQKKKPRKPEVANRPSGNSSIQEFVDE
jgi:hypothetical protein